MCRRATANNASDSHSKFASEISLPVGFVQTDGGQEAVSGLGMQLSVSATSGTSSLEVFGGAGFQRLLPISRLFA